MDGAMYSSSDIAFESDISHIYTDLDSTVGQFRLLDLEPGEEGDPLIFSLTTESLSGGRCPSYETISYHWGGHSTDHSTAKASVRTRTDLSEHRCIDVPVKKWNVPTAAAQALECMRLPNQARRLWIDSICINQDNREEREQQIALMGDIYRTGTRNLVYLGTANAGEAAAAVDALRNAYQRLQTELSVLSTDAQRDWREQRIKPSGWGKLEMPPLLVKDPQLIKAMFRCVWFTRLWVVQEACLAYENTCHWAGEKFDLQELMDVVHISRELEVAGDDEYVERFKTYCCLQQLRYPLLIRRQFRSGNIANPVEATAILSDIVRQSDVSHPQDRIYAVAGLLRSLPGESQEATRLFEANYNKPLTAVFRDATRAILLSSGTDELLARLSHRSKAELNDVGKPSWSFYWDRPSDLVHEAGRPTLYTTFHAGVPEAELLTSKKLVVGKTGDEPDIVSLRGFLLGPIRDFIPYATSGTFLKNRSAMLDLVESVLNLSRAEPQDRCEATSMVSTQTRAQADVLRIREIERANEVVRRRLVRKTGNMEIEAYSDRIKSRTTSFSQADQVEERRGPLTNSDDRVNMTALTVLTAGWWDAQFGNVQVALKAFRALRNHIAHSNEPPRVLSDAFNMHMVIATSSNNRCFFTADSGHVGCGPKITEAGDIVAVFLGAKYPYLLRPTTPLDGTYRFVGMTIIPRIMHGEVFRRNVKVQTIRLR